jgi:hypothetical protein
LKTRTFVSALAWVAPLLLASSVSSTALAADPLNSPTDAQLPDDEDNAARTQDNGSSAPAGPNGGGTNSVGPSGGGVSVTLGGTPAATTTGTPADQPKEEKKAPKEKWVDRFAGSSIFTQVSSNFDTFAPGFSPNRDPIVESWTRFGPRFNITKDFQLRGLVSVVYEMTNSNSTTYKREPTLSDTTLQLFYRGIPAVLDKHLKFQPFVFTGLPTSKESRARTLFVQPGAGLQAAFAAEHVLGGEFMAIAQVAYSRPIYQSTTATSTDGRPYENACFGGSAGDTSCGNQLNGLANVRDQFSWLFIVVQEWGKWSPGLFWRMGHAAPYQFKDIPGVQRVQDGPPGFRNDTFFSAWLDYHLNDWLTPEVGYQFGRRFLGDNGRYANPIWDNQQDMRIYIGANIQLDSLYKSIAGEGGEAGVVRAKNRANPLFQF